MAVNKLFISKLGACFILFVATGLTGCDKISSVYEHMTKKESAKSAPTSAEKSVSPSKNIPAETPKSKETLPANVVASVGEWSITLDEFNDKMSKLKDILPEFDPTDINSKKLILEELVRQELLVREAEQSGVAQQKEITETVADFRKTLLVQEVATKLTKDIKATEADAQAYYDKNKENFIVKSEWKVREIVAPSEAEAKEILVQLLQGSGFAEIAKAKSKSATANKGGDIGWVVTFPFDQMRAAVIALETGKTSSVFKGPNGYYIVKLEDKRGGTPKPFLAIKVDLTKKLTLKKQQEAVLEHLNTLAEKTKIQVNEELLK